MPLWPVGLLGVCRARPAASAATTASRKKRAGPGARLALCRSGLLALGLGSGHDGFRYLFHGLALLAALPAKGEVGFFLAEARFALQDALGAFNQLSCFEFFGELRTFFLKAGHFDFRADEKTDGGYEADFGFAVRVRFAILQIDDANGAATAQQRNGQKGFVTVLG